MTDQVRRSRVAWRWQQVCCRLGMPALLFLFTLLAAFDRPVSAEELGNDGGGPSSLPRPVIAPSEEEIEGAIRRGIDFLLEIRNRDGSWGSATDTKDLNIYAPIPGAHQAFRVAVTSLVISALIQSGDSRPEVTEAIQRASEWLSQRLGRVRRANQDAIYNVWAHAYALEALADLLTCPGTAHEQHEAIRELMATQVDYLRRFESVDHGWSYYDFRYHAARPTSTPNSFTTATALIGLRRAVDAGVDVPQDLVDRGVRCVQRQRNPDFTYFYYANGVTTIEPVRLINRAGGSLGRTHACNFALRLWGDPAVTDEVIESWLDRLFRRNGWLDIGRKRPVPHEAYFQVAGYFFYYGHWHAARSISLLPIEGQVRHQQQMARRMIDLQERNGSWWDYPFYAYHQPYGTAMAIMTLVHCRPASNSSGN